jgi:ubiquinone biosynthesis protein
MITASFSSGLRIPAEMTLLAKAMVHLDDITRTLDPTYAPMETVRSFITEAAQERAKSQVNVRQLYRVVSQSADLLTALPRRLDLITDKLANNELRVRLDMPEVDHLLDGAQKVANRVFSGLVLAGLLVASGMLLPTRPIIAIWGMGIAAGIGLYMVFTILWSDRAHAKGDD